MEFKNFLTQIKNPSFWQAHHQYCFEAEEYPYLFFQMFFTHIKTKKIITIQINKFISDDGNEQSLYTHLQQTMLGMQSFYWLGNILETVSKKQKKNIQEFLSTYNGPNVVGYWVSSSDAPPSQTIKIPLIINQQNFYELMNFFDKKFHPKKLDFIKTFFEEISTISLSFACTMLTYLDLSSLQMLNQLYDYLLKALKIQPSLTILSEYFFSKKPYEFFSVWKKLAHEYPEIFWVTFWTEQIWRAYYTKKFLTQQNFSKARKMSFRLPYSFIKRDLEKIKLKDLADLHDQMYGIDYALKSGSTFCSLEKFYLNHFLLK